MPKSASTNNLRRRQLDRMFETPIKLSDIPEFRHGFIAELRKSLGMSTTQLAKMLGLSQSAVTQIEEREREGTISLNVLRKVATALDCKLVYALVPNQSLGTLVRMRADKVANALLKRVGHSTALEDQSTSALESKRQAAEIAEELARHLDKRLWEETD